MQQTYNTSKGKVVIHYVYNGALKKVDDFKFKRPVNVKIKVKGR